MGFAEDAAAPKGGVEVAGAARCTDECGMGLYGDTRAPPYV